eukprot:UN07055
MSRLASMGGELDEVSRANFNRLVVLLNDDERALLIVGYIRVSLTKIPLDISKLIIGLYGVIGSNVKSENNLRTVSRLRQEKLGNPQRVHFDENVLVYAVPHWDPSRIVGDDEPNVKHDTDHICAIWCFLCCCSCCDGHGHGK